MADWKGRLEDRPWKIKIEVLPGDPCDINQLLDDLAAADHLILRYQVEGRRLIQVTTFEKHQHVSEKEKRSECLPPPPEWRQAEPVSIGAKEGSPQIDTGTKPVSSRSEPSVTPAASQNQPGSPFSTALPPTALPFTSLPHASLPSENLTTRVRKKSENAHTYASDFEAFWQEYPSHIDKRRAFGCWKSRLKQGIISDLLVACAGHYAAARRGEEERYTMHPATFLGPGRRWEQFLETKKKGGHGHGEIPTYSKKTAGWEKLYQQEMEKQKQEGVYDGGVR